MQIDPLVINAITIIIVALIIMIGVVSVLAPAALNVSLKPMLEIMSRMISLLEGRPQPPQPPP